MKVTAVIIGLIAPLLLWAQKPAVKFDKQLHDFGQVQKWNNPPAYFLFTNTGKSDVLFLPTTQQKDIFVDIPKGYIKPAHTDTIVIYYFTDQLGEFQKSAELFTNNSPTPVSLVVKGNIVSLDERAYISCPGFAPKMERVDELALIMMDSVPDAKTAPVEMKPTATIAATDEVMEFEEPGELEEPKVVSQVKTVEAPPVVNEKNDDGVLPRNLYAPNNIIFLIDISGSMKKPDKLPLLKISMKNLTHVLRGVDYVSVIVYSTTSAVMLPSTSANRKDEITVLIDTLKTHGITNGVKGLQTAYEMAEQNFIPGGNNQVIIATDGIFNSPSFTESAIYSLVRDKAEKNIILSVVGFGDDKDAVRMMKKMAEKGKGSFIQIPDKLAADAILIEEIKMQSAIGNN